MDIQKVIKGLELCSNTGRPCCPDDCPYYKGYTSCDRIELLRDALELLKEYQHTDEQMIEKNCFTCANSFVDDDDKLHCMADGHDHEQIVDDDYTCDDWTR